MKHSEMLRNIMWNRVEKEGNSLQFFFLWISMTLIQLLWWQVPFLPSGLLLLISCSKSIKRSSQVANLLPQQKCKNGWALLLFELFEYLEKPWRDWILYFLLHHESSFFKNILIHVLNITIFFSKKRVFGKGNLSSL